MNDVVAQLGPLLDEPHRAAASQPDQSQRRDQQRRHRRVAPAPAPGALAPAHGPGLDRPALHEPSQVVGQRRGAGVATLRLLGQALQADRLEVARHFRVQSRGGDRLVMDHLPLRFGRRLSSKRRPAGEHLIEQGAERVDVRGRPDRSRLPDHLLGGHVAGSPDPSAAQCQRRLSVKVPRQPEIGDLGRAARR